MKEKTTYYYTYEIYVDNPGNPLHGHYYYGKHITRNLADGYTGSGKLICQYKKQHGDVHLRKTILNFYNSREELDEAEQELVARKKAELGDLCCNMHAGGRDGHWIAYVSPEIRAERREKAMIGFMKHTTPESRRSNAIKATRVRSEHIAKNPEIWKQICRQVHANRTPEQKKEVYDKVSNSLKQYYEREDEKVLEAKRCKNKATNIESARSWRNEFQELFGHTPEYFRKFGLQGAALKLYRQIKNVDKEVQKHEIKRFMASVNR